MNHSFIGTEHILLGLVRRRMLTGTAVVDAHVRAGARAPRTHD